MQLIIQNVLSSIVFFPYMLLVIVAVVAKKAGVSGMKAFGYGADVTTFTLFFSVSLAIEGIWQTNVMGYVGVALMAIGIAVTYQEWRIKKELQLPLLVRKIWRVYFLVLSLTYMVVLVVGFIQTIVQWSK